VAQLQYRVSPAGFSDWTGLYALLDACFAYMEARIDPPSSLKQMTPDSLREKAEEETLVAVLHDGALVACGFLRETDETIYIGKLAVKPTFRKRGILRSILQIAYGLARDKNKSELELEIRIELTENHETFAALGFQKSGDFSHDDFDRPTSITMKKPVFPLA